MTILFAPFIRKLKCLLTHLLKTYLCEVPQTWGESDLGGVEVTDFYKSITSWLLLARETQVKIRSCWAFSVGE